jgi:glucose-1-phosphate thymidylyltransferase
MKAIILAGGFAKRMWPLTLEKPKPLLPVAGKPMIEHVLEKVLPIEGIDQIYITTNKKFEPVFREWLEASASREKIQLFIEETGSEEEKLGSIGALNHILEREGIDDDVLVLAGDNLFQDQFQGLLDFFKEKGTMVFGLHELENHTLLPKMGIVSIDNSGKVTEFEEKPESPKSNLVSTALYLIPRNQLPLIREYIQAGENPDTFGHLMSWLHKRIPIHGFVFKNKWIDIGSMEAYDEANGLIKNR